MIIDTIGKIVATYTQSAEDEGYDLINLKNKIKTEFGLNMSFEQNEDSQEIEQRILQSVEKRRNEIQEEVGSSRLREIERIVLLRIVDSKWMEHIDNMDQLRQGINLRAVSYTHLCIFLICVIAVVFYSFVPL